ncbi:MAG TPA: chemotaxis protein CheW [Candidatus Sulfotelmatobacter sp.]|nr:chemotaxis protein CheW [Candidatus Sulfotelmatobacter sp.]
MSVPETALSRMGPTEAAEEAGAAAGEQLRLVVFRLADEWFALPIAEVREIQPLSEITRVPNAPPQILGIVNVRGHILTLLTLESLLGIPRAVPPTHAMILDLGVPDPYVGVAIHGAAEVRRVPAADVEPSPAGPGGPGGLDGVLEIEGRVVGLLRLGRLLAPWLSEWGVEAAALC